jgi:TP901 family phage tail tape measure protein
MAVGVNIVSEFDSKGIKRAVADFKKLEGAGAKSTYALRTIDSAAKNMAASLAKVGLAAGAIGGLAVKQFAAFDDAMTQSTAIMGNLSAEMRDRMSAAAREMARTSTFSATEAAESFYFLASAGLDATASIEALPVVAKFAQAGMFNMAQATSLLADAQSALGMSIRNDAVANMRNMTRVSDVLVKANILANASVQQFSEALTNKAAASMRSLNMDIEEGVAVLAVFADQGVKGSEAGTVFTAAIRGLTNGAKNNAAAFKQMGIEVFDSSGAMNNMSAIVGQMEKSLGGLSVEQQRAALAELGFTEETLRGALSLIGKSDALVRYEEELRKAGGTTEEVAANQLTSLSAQLKLARNAINDVAIILGEKLAPYVRAIAGFVQNLSFAISERGLGGGLSYLKERIFENISSMGTFGNVIYGLITAFVALRLVAIAATVAQVAFGVSLLANPIGIVVAAIVALGVLLAALYLKFEPVRTVIDAIGKALFKTFKEIAEKVMNYFIIQINAVLVAINAMIWAANKLGADIEEIGYIGLQSFNEVGTAAEAAGKKMPIEQLRALRQQFNALRADRNIVIEQNKEEEKGFTGLGGAVKSTVDKMKQFKDALRGVASAQRSVRDANKAAVKANEDLAAANERVTRAQERFQRVVAGFGVGSREARTQSGILVRAQRNLERSGYGVEQAVFAVAEAEAELAQIRLDPSASPQKIREAEIALAEAKLSVLEATEAQAQATEDLTTAEQRLDEVVNGAKEGSDAYKEALDDLNAAKRDQIAATDAVTDAYERQRDAVEKLREAEKKLKEDRKGLTPAQIAKATNMANTPLNIATPTAQIGSNIAGMPVAGESLTDFASRVFGADIPMLADGGIVRKATLAVVGEAGPEAVVPLDSAVGGGMNVYVTVNAGMGTDPAKLGDEIVNVLQRYNRRNGALPLRVA